MSKNNPKTSYQYLNMTKNLQNSFTKNQPDSYLVVLVVTDPDKQPKTREKI
jgi:hypothetical protein